MVNGVGVAAGKGVGNDVTVGAAVGLVARVGLGTSIICDAEVAIATGATGCTGFENGANALEII